jgi:hypothetical protein
MIPKCPSCEEQVLEVKAGNVTFRDRAGVAQFASVFLCEKCGHVSGIPTIGKFNGCPGSAQRQGLNVTCFVFSFSFLPTETAPGPTSPANVLR